MGGGNFNGDISEKNALMSYVNECTAYPLEESQPPCKDGFIIAKEERCSNPFKGRYRCDRWEVRDSPLPDTPAAETILIEVGSNMNANAVTLDVPLLIDCPLLVVAANGANFSVAVDGNMLSVEKSSTWWSPDQDSHWDFDLEFECVAPPPFSASEVCVCDPENVNDVDKDACQFNEAYTARCDAFYLNENCTEYPLHFTQAPCKPGYEPAQEVSCLESVGVGFGRYLCKEKFSTDGNAISATVTTSTTTTTTTSTTTMLAARFYSKHQASCPAGKYSVQTAFGFKCIACKHGFYKTEDMYSNGACKAKIGFDDCDKGSYLLEGFSTSKDDNLCVADNECGPGLFVANKIQGAKGALCAACEPGTFSVAPSTSTRCVNKSTASCPAGTYLIVGASAQHDDSVCVECPYGTFKDADGTMVCTAKTIVSSCAPGEFVTFGSSSKEDDNACRACPEGTWKEGTNDAAVCTAKQVRSCTAGYYLKKGTSTTLDDFYCIACPAGTFASTLSTAERCIAKSPATCRSDKRQWLYKGSSPFANDNACIEDNECPAGFKFGSGDGQDANVGSELDFTPPSADGADSTVDRCCDQKWTGCLPRSSNTTEQASQGDAYCKAFIIPQPAKYSGVNERSSKSWMPTYCKAWNEARWQCESNCGCAAVHSPQPLVPIVEQLTNIKLCSACPVGQYLSEASGATSCINKTTTSCEPGSRLNLGESAIEDDSACTKCEPGTWSGPEVHSSHYCYLKLPVPKQCPAGTHRSFGGSRIRDDHECKTCKLGTFQSDEGSDAVTCTPKVKPVTCIAGQFLQLGSSNAEDDWKCAACPADTWSGKVSDAQECAQKITDNACVLPEVFVASNNAKADNYCIVGGICPPGKFVENITTCTTCPKGTFSNAKSDAAKCTAKKMPTGCEAGHFLSLGNSAGRDDYRCAACPAGQYMSYSKATDRQQDLDIEDAAGSSISDGSLTCKTLLEWLGSAGVCTDSNVQHYDWAQSCPAHCAQLTQKTATKCIEKRLLVNDVGVEKCGPGTEASYGESRVANDWFCEPKTRATALCMKEVETSAHSLVPGIYIGLPERIEPFVKSYSASMRSPGHPRSDVSVGVVVEGERFISDAERVPFPEGRPLLVLHDPPGGGSFAAFHNVLATTTVAEHVSTVEAGEEFESKATFGSKAEFEFGISLAVAAAPMGIGPIVGTYTMPPGTKVEWDFKGGPQFDMEHKVTSGSEATVELDSSSVEFTYATSPGADKAGPASDVFLVPSLFFEVTQVWVVSLSDKEEGCLAQGRDEKTLSVRKDLSGFAFTVANDVETRVLPLLKEVAADVGFRINCENDGNCCTPAEELMDCKARTLRERCSFLHPGDDTSDSWKACFGIKEDHFKTECAAAESLAIQSGSTDDDSTDTLGKCSTSVIKAKGVQDYCNKQFAPAGSEDAEACSKFTKTTQYSMAHDDWYNSLSRNYANQKKAFDPSQAAVYTRMDSLSGSSVPLPTSEPVKAPSKMEGLAPEALLRNAKDRHGKAHSDDKIQEFREYNVLQFEGGGSTFEYTADLGAVHVADDYRDATDFGGENTETKTYDAGLGKNLKQKYMGGAFLEGAMAGGAFGFEFELGLKAGAELVDVSTTTKTVGDNSDFMLHLEDGDIGDYFLVRLYQDPDYGVPLFVLDGGASSCGWEPNTAHRTAPSISVEYTGPDNVPPNEPVIFKVTVSNAENYYEAGPESKERTGWADNDLGYSAKDFELELFAASVESGLQLSINGKAFQTGILFAEFGKGSTEVLIEARRGPATFEFAAPQIRFKELCDGVDGETSVEAELGMAGDMGDRKIKFVESCPPVAWSGSILQDATFIVQQGNQPYVKIQVVNPSAARTFEEAVETLQFEFRTVGSAHWTKGMELPFETAPTNWDVGTLPDADYEIRVTALCPVVDGVSSAYYESSTPVVRGVVDRHGPKLVQVAATTLDSSLDDGAVIVARFTEDVVCNGAKPGTSGQMNVAIKIVSGTQAVEGDAVHFSCDGSQLSFSSSQPISDTDAATTVSISGLTDAAGNDMVPVVDRPLQVGSAARDRNQISDKVSSLEIKMEEHQIELKTMLAKLTGDTADATAAAKEFADKQLAIADAAAQAAEDAKVAAEEKLEAEEAAAAAAATAAQQAADDKAEADAVLEELLNQADPDADALADAQEAADKAAAAADDATDAVEQAALKVNTSRNDVVAAEAHAAASKANLDAQATKTEEATQAVSNPPAEVSKDAMTYRLVIAVLCFVIFLGILVALPLFDGVGTKAGRKKGSYSLESPAAAAVAAAALPVSAIAETGFPGRSVTQQAANINGSDELYDFAAGSVEPARTSAATTVPARVSGIDNASYEVPRSASQAAAYTDTYGNMPFPGVPRASVLSIPGNNAGASGYQLAAATTRPSRTSMSSSI